VEILKATNKPQRGLMDDFPYELSIHAQERVNQREIELQWIKRVLEQPTRIEADKKDSELTHALGIVPEFDDRVLRVIYNHTTTPWRIVSLHFVRSLKGKL
jgi:hypothetical protein